MFETHRWRQLPLTQDIQFRTIILALHHPTGGRKPKLSVAIAEDIGDRILLLACRQTSNLDMLSFLGGGMIHKHPLQQRRYPQIGLFIDSHSQYRRILNHPIQVVIATTELLFIIVVGKKALIIRTQPDVLSGILENLSDIGIRHRQRKIGFVLTFQRMSEQIQFKESVT